MSRNPKLNHADGKVAPKNWSDYANWLRAHPTKPKNGKGNLHDRLDTIEQMLKDKK